MCGICGIYGAEDKPLLLKMLSTLKHRGPDSQGVFCDSRISLGHSRLSIIDLSNKGKQPMSNEEGDIWISVNGEIYNFKALRAQLQQLGHEFHSDSDSEVVVHAYEEYGIRFLQRLRGMFALAIYDSKTSTVLLARDRIGKKPLYYAIDDGRVIFASEIKAILEAGIAKKINFHALCAYLTFQYSLGVQTLFDGIKKIEPGTFLLCSDGKIRRERYWDLCEASPTTTREDEIADVLRAMLEESAQLRMIADVPVGAFLSGGIDSSSVVALARPHFSDSDFHTFSLGFEKVSEFRYARVVSEHLDTVHHEIVITPEDVARDIDRVAWYYDEPLGDAAIINNYYLSKEAKKHVTVVVAGEGGDELFAGYPAHGLARNMYRFYRLPRVFRGIIHPLSRLIPGRGDICSRNNTIYRKMCVFGQKNFGLAYFQLGIYMSSAEKEKLMYATCPDPVASAICGPEMKDPLNKMLALDCKNLLPEKFLMKADKGTMANSIEERLPLLDQEIINYAFSIPSSLKLKNGVEKYILRKAVKDLLPRATIDRKKIGFGTPLDAWMSGELHERVINSLQEGPLISHLFRLDKLHKLVQKFQDNPQFRFSTIWTIFALEVWHETFFN
ncbi:MAG: asparagine synthase (glutamine-hydrolyzing) [Halobacteriota archaeon]